MPCYKDDCVLARGVFLYTVMDVSCIRHSSTLTRFHAVVTAVFYVVHFFNMEFLIV